MLTALLISALAAHAAPAKRQLTGNTPGDLISFPTGNTVPYFAQDLCLATNPAGQSGLGDGTPVGFVDCHSVQTVKPDAALYGLWNIHSGNQQGIQLVGTNYCLDAGENPGSSGSTPGKVWTCLPNTPQQQFYYTGDNHIAVTGYTPCLDYSSSAGTNFVACGSNSDNGDVQSFTLMPIAGGSGSGSSSPSSTTSSIPVVTPSMVPPSASGREIYWANGNDYSQCLTVTNGQFYNGSPVGIAACTGAANQKWEYSYGVTSVRVSGQSYCIDFGTGGGSDGTAMKIWQCYSGLFQQTMYYTNDNHIAVYNGNQCLDVQAGTSNVQSWACSGPDVNQHWAQQI